MVAIFGVCTTQNLAKNNLILLAHRRDDAHVRPRVADLELD